MKTLYQAANAVEAHMLVDLLQQEGVTAHIQGEHLQGAVGGLPAAGLVRLVVDEADHAQARAVIERWEAAQPQEAPPASVPRRSSSLGPFLSGLVIGAAVLYAFYRVPYTVDGMDHNRDGVLDERWTYSPNGTPLQYEADRNLDGKIDFKGGYDPRGVMQTAEADDNFDGVFETRTHYRAGNAEVSEVDTDGDGLPDLRSRYSSGVLATTEYLEPLSGRRLRVEHLVLGKLTTADVDTDQDGRLDTRYRYDRLAAVSGTEKIQP